MRQCVNVILTRIFSVINIKVDMTQTILRKQNIQRAQYLYNDRLVLNFRFLKGTMLLGKEILSKMQSLTLQLDVSSTNCERESLPDLSKPAEEMQQHDSALYCISLAEIPVSF